MSQHAIEVAAAPSSCTFADHDALKLDRHTWLAATKHCGYMADGAGGQMELRQCRRCYSSLAMPAGPVPTASDLRSVHLELRRGWRLVIRRDDGLPELSSDDTGERLSLEVLAGRQYLLRLVARRLGRWLAKARRYYAPEHPTRKHAEAARVQVLSLLYRWEMEVRP